MEKIFGISDDISIMRNGSFVGTLPASEMDNNKIIKYMVGRELKILFSDKTNVVQKEVVFRVENYTSPNPLSFKECYFELKRVEVLGVGAQRTELMEAIYGMSDIVNGDLYNEGNQIKINRPTGAIKNGIALVTENRRHNGIFGVLSVSDSVAIASIDQYLGMGNLLNQERIDEVVDASIDCLSIKTASNQTHISNLSGGNQQKVILSRWSANNPDILILD